MTEIEREYKDDGSLARVIMKVGDGKGNLRVQGLKDIHPIYEALTALFKKNLSDSQIVARYAKDEKSLREVIAVEALLDRVPENRKIDLASKLTSGKDLAELTDFAALEIAEGKRTKDGAVLEKASNHIYKPFFKKALSNAEMYNVYIDKRELDKINENAKIAQIKTVWAITASAITAIALAASIYLGYVNISFGKKPQVEQTQQQSSSVPAVMMGR